MYSHGFLKVAACSPKSRLADCMYNAKEILNVLNSEEMKSKNPAIVAFPELSIPGYSIGDLVFQKYLYDESQKALKYLLKNVTYKGVYIVGSFVYINDLIYNCAIVCQQGEILGIVPKSFLPNTNEFHEGRWFSSADEILGSVNFCTYICKEVPFGRLLFKCNDVAFGVEICADMWAPASPNETLYASGAVIVFNLSASPAIVNKKEKRETLTKAISLKMNGAYVYVSNNASESTSELVFSSHKIISYNGDILSSDDEISFESRVIYADIDVCKLHSIRRCNSYYKNAQTLLNEDLPVIEFKALPTDEYKFEKPLDPLPFVPKSDDEFKEIIDIQTISVIKRLDYIGINHVVIGVSGGLDSTLALLSLVYAFDKHGISRKNIIGVRLPSNSNSSNTYNNSVHLMEKLRVTQLEINIMDQVNGQLKKIGHDGIKHDVTYENVQARYRTYCLMNLANLHNAIVVGTSDMSEVALGWSTFNGDQMAMYGLNAGLTKTALREVCRYYINIYPEVAGEINRIIETPISPELAGSNQKTEDLIGKYEINDFILYHFMVNKDSFERISYLMQKAFNVSKEFADKSIDNFNKRFYSQQYKRLTMPEGVKIMDLSLSPRTEVKLNGDIYPPVKLINS